ncbi:MAG: DUF6492 family protein [Pseudomonadota bacterium]
MAKPEARRTVIVTPSYAGDFERCRLLCETIDHFVADADQHLILVAAEDLEQFATLAGPRRTIVDERDLLPAWLRSQRLPSWLPARLSARPFWLSTRTWPMRGWHVQQLRRLAIAKHTDTDGFLFCDSDMVFVRPFSLAELWQGDGQAAALRLYCNVGGIHDGLPNGGRLHQHWTRGAAALLGLPEPKFPADDFINNMVTWRRDTMLDLLARIEDTAGRHWVEAIGRYRTFSECQIYGAFAQDRSAVLAHRREHWPADFGLCQTYWSGEALGETALRGFLETMDPRQVAVGLQSFTGTDPAILRSLVLR